jgi:NTP pyrophosphatase (non-canonical NTP hydrolase)
MGKGKGMIIEVTPFVLDCSEKEQACKVLEEAAEVFGAWQTLQECAYVDARTDSNGLGVTLSKLDLADEIADVIQAACNLAERNGINVVAAMARCTERQRARGRL